MGICYNQDNYNNILIKRMPWCSQYTVSKIAKKLYIYHSIWILQFFYVKKRRNVLKKSSFFRMRMIMRNGGGTVGYFEHILKSFDQIDKEMLRKVVNYYLSTTLNQIPKNTSLTKEQRAYYWIYKNSKILC